MARFIHTADWQIGRQFGRFPQEDAAALFEARFDVIERIGQLATENACDAVLVAGDVFDLQAVSDRTLRRTFNAMASFSGPWVLLPGNHDAALAESVWTLAEHQQLVPDHVHLALSPEPVELADAGLVVLPAPLTQRQTYKDLTAWFDQADTAEDLIRVGLAHGSVEGELQDDIDATNPIARDRAHSARLDYLALGDWHGLKQIDDKTWYSGTPEPERFKDNGPGHALLVDLPGPGQAPAVTTLNTARYRWQQWQREIQVESDVDELIAELEALPPDQVMDIQLNGTVTLAGERRLGEALAAAAARQRSVQSHMDGLVVEPTAEDIAELKADGYMAEVLETLKQRQVQGEDDDTISGAMLILARLLREKQAKKDGP